MLICFGGGLKRITALGKLVLGEGVVLFMCSCFSKCGVCLFFTVWLCSFVGGGLQSRMKSPVPSRAFGTPRPWLGLWEAAAFRLELLSDSEERVAFMS